MSNRNQVLDLFDAKAPIWKKKANAGIEQNRKGFAKITVIDEKGKAVSNAKIKVIQKTHEFKFGANVFMLKEFESEEKNEKYEKYFSNLFNMATLPFYWDTLEPIKGQPRYDKNSPKIYRRPPIDLCIEFCEKHGIEPREHALAYEYLFPKWLSGYKTCEVKKELERRFSEIAERYADKIPIIEVTNEMLWEKGTTDFYKEENFVEWCFKLAEKYFPKNTLCINEWTDRCWEGGTLPTDDYYSYIEKALSSGARIDAIGMQYHLFNKREEEYEKTRLTLNPQSLYEHLDLYSTFSKPLQITEVTVPAYSWQSSDEEIQAKIIENLYTIWFSHPNVEQIIYWNLADGYAHVPDATLEKIKQTQGNMAVGENYYHGGLLRFDLSPKPAYFTIKNLIKNVWRTEETLLSNETGGAKFKGFYGEYEVEIVVNGNTYSKKLNLSKKSQNDFTIQL